MNAGSRLWVLTAGAAGGAVAIAIMETFAVQAAFPLMTVPFATSIVMVMGLPAAEPAQPRALVGGHLVATLVGLAVVKLAGPGHWQAACAVGLAILAMQLTRTFHPPAGINPLIVVVNDLSWSFLLVPVGAGALILAAFSFVWHNFVSRRPWPAQWW
jgi:CBS-domain-containing membrane protein